MTDCFFLDAGPGKAGASNPRAAALVSALGGRSIVLIGLMGSGKSSTGRRLAQELGLPFVDTDAEIESAAGMPITEIFAQHGEECFRDGERRVMASILSEGPRVVATGGGAFMNAETRARIASSGISVWLKADLDVLWRRVRKRSHRPLLHGDNPEDILRRLMDQRYPVYAEANVTVVSREGPHDLAVMDVIEALERYLIPAPQFPAPAIPPANIISKTAADLPPRADCAEVRVDLGPGSYPIFIGKGLLEEAGRRIQQLAPKSACAIVTDENVAALYLPAAEKSLRDSGIRYSAVIVPPGEGSKSFETYAKVCNDLLKARPARSDIVVALGGGVIGDLAGFAAATLLRGMRFVQMPTTLLAQVDSSVGGKTGINAPHGKNLVGAFHQPTLVLADTDALETLPLRELRAGYAEVVKYGLIGDAGFFAWLEAHAEKVLSGGPERIHAIAVSCRAKAAIVGRDERESGERALLNLGHTFGHALERLTAYDSQRLVHGEAVAIGMACAYRFSARKGLCAKEEAARVEAHLQGAGLPVRIAEIPGWSAPPGAILDAMYQDKKVSHGALTFVLARAIGDCFVANPVDASDVLSFLQDELRA